MGFLIFFLFGISDENGKFVQFKLKFEFLKFKSFEIWENTCRFKCRNRVDTPLLALG